VQLLIGQNESLRCYPISPIYLDDLWLLVNPSEIQLVNLEAHPELDRQHGLQQGPQLILDKAKAKKFGNYVGLPK
jgi:hypothetical protein